MIKYFPIYDELKDFVEKDHPQVNYMNVLDATHSHHKLYFKFLEWYCSKLEQEGWTVIQVDPLFARRRDVGRR